ncbi:unnamed protein product [Meganyctiphanes norvegica]|uniref:C-type lectin domain-containing protein n=1 Tax=Meganyctiphanes norvegica TaxID=48144 RepID=A0AAV2R250_MEGNR
MTSISIACALIVGVCAGQPPLKLQHGSSDIYKSVSPIWADQSPMKNLQEDTEISVETPTVVPTNQLPRPLDPHHADNSDIAKEMKVFDKADPSCSYPFEPVGNMCYFFSEEKMNFHGAVTYCATLVQGHTGVTLAMLDYSREGNQALLDAAAARQNTFWVGGQTEDGVEWRWQDNREINLQAPFWRLDEPNAAQNKCLVAQVTSWGNIVRSLLYDYGCEDSLNFICENTCPVAFQRIGKHCYFHSEEYGLEHLSWQDARDYCQALSVHDGYHADLAVLGLPDQDDYHLMFNLHADYTGNAWIGAFAETACNFEWVDGRTLPTTSIYWVYDDPDCEENQPAVFLAIGTAHNQTSLGDTSETSLYPFVCQMFRNT